MRQAAPTVGRRPALIEGIVEVGLLILLGETDSYGYELVAALARRGLVPRPVPPARVYEALRRLELEGAVLSRHELSPAGPERRRYARTSAGTRRLCNWVEALRLTEHSLRTVLDAYESQRKEVISMCCKGSTCQCEATPASEEHGHAVSESLEARVARLETELRESRSHD